MPRFGRPQATTQSSQVGGDAHTKGTRDAAARHWSNSEGERPTAF